MTQKDLVLEHLKSGMSITPLIALERYGSFRLGSIINRLRNEGHNISTKLNPEKHYAIYTYIGLKQNEIPTELNFAVQA